MMAWLEFTIIALVILNSGLNVVKSTDLVHTVFWLALTLLGTAALFVHLDAEFLAAVQVLLYTGGVVTLMLFGVMLTRRIDGVKIIHESENKGRALLSALAVFGAIATAILRRAPSSCRDDLPETEALGLYSSRSRLAVRLFAALLSAMVGAIALARKVDP